jgi:hypothetical protein
MSTWYAEPPDGFSASFDPAWTKDVIRRTKNDSSYQEAKHMTALALSTAPPKGRSLV